MLALAVAYLVGASKVPLDLWVVAGRWAQVAVVVWAAVLCGLIVHPMWVRGHIAAAGLAVIVFGGRGGGFLQAVLGGRPDLWVAVGERVVMATAAVLWHLRSLKVIDLRRAYTTLVRTVAALEATREASRPSSDWGASE